MTDAGAISIPGLTIPDVVSGYAHRQPQAEAIVCAEQRLSWAGFVKAYHRGANALIAHGLRKGDKVALLMHNSIEMAVLIMAVAKAGGVLVPLSPLFDGAALARMIERADVDYLFATQDNLATIASQPQMLHAVRDGGKIAVDFHAPGWLHYEIFTAGASTDEPAVMLRLDDVFNIMFTSGTTGDPKGAVHSHLSRLLYPLGWGGCARH